MERRSNRIRERRERAIQRRVPSDEERNVPPRGRQNQRNQGHNNQDNGGRHELPENNNVAIEEEVEQNVEEEEIPPPPHHVLADVMDRQTQLLERLAGRQDQDHGHGKMAAFMRLHPPTFDSAEEDPLAADDWLRAITKKLSAVRATEEEKVILATHQLNGPAGEWWENYQEADEEPETIT